MAYKKEYLLKNKHDPNIQVGEERSFTNEFTNPLVKFNSKNTIIAISHNFNTFNKRELCLGGTLKIISSLEEIEEPIENYIDPTIYSMMKEIYYEEKITYDFVYLLGYLSNKFSPKDNNLDETQYTIVKLCENIVKKGLSVVIYGEFDENDYMYNNVKYIHWKKFPYHQHFKILVLSTTGILNALPFNINADKIYWDSYENPIGNDLLINLYNKNKNKINKIFFKSNFHYQQTINILGNIGNYYIIPSGVRIDKFSLNKYNIVRQRYRFMYDASYDRGLEFIITGIFSVIKKIESRAELHVYGGMDNIKDENFKNKMLMLFSENGVTDHGKQSLDVLSREKHLSEFNIYISNIINEISCQSIKESIVAGCIPLTVNFGIFMETEGIKFLMNHNDNKIMQKCALEILNLCKDSTKLETIRKQFMNSDTINSFENYCNKITNLLIR
jgi:hypothetical protein